MCCSDDVAVRKCTVASDAALLSFASVRWQMCHLCFCHQLLALQIHFTPSAAAINNTAAVIDVNAAVAAAAAAA